MNFMFKHTLKIFCIIMLLPFSFVSACETPRTLVGQGEEDPLKLQSFLENHAPSLLPVYQEIQNAKLDADTEKLFKIKEKFELWGASNDGWDRLVQVLTNTVEGDPVALWAQQTPHHCIGGLIFYPQELLHNPEGDETIYYHPGLAASLAISASFGNAVAIYELSEGYLKIASQCRRKPENEKEEKEQASQDKEQSLHFYKKAIHLFKDTKNPSKIAQVYLIKYLYDREQNISDEEFENLLKNIDHLYAFYELGLFYENRDTRNLPKANKQSEVSKDVKNSYEYYLKALQGGYERAIWGIQRLSHFIPTEEKLYEAGKAQGLYLLAERRRVNGNTKDLYDRSGQLGRLYSYIDLAEKILREEIPARNRIEEAILNYQKADRPGFAQGSRHIVRNPSLCPSPLIKIEFTLKMINLKDLEGYANLLTCWDIKRYHPQIEKLFSTQKDILEKYQGLLQEREKVLNVIKTIRSDF